MLDEALSRGTWEEFQKRCTLQHSHLAASLEKLNEQVEALTEATSKLKDAVSGHSWFRQMMTGLLALALGLMYPTIAPALKTILR